MWNWKKKNKKRLNELDVKQLERAVEFIVKEYKNSKDPYYQGFVEGFKTMGNFVKFRVQENEQ